MEELADEYREWQEENLFTNGRVGHDLGADELLLADAVIHHGELLTDEQRAWLKDFTERWDRQQELVDRLANLLFVDVMEA